MQDSKEGLSSAVKRHLVQKLQQRGAGKGLGTESGIVTEPLRGYAVNVHTSSCNLCAAHCVVRPCNFYSRHALLE